MGHSYSQTIFGVQREHEWSIVILIFCVLCMLRRSTCIISQHYGGLRKNKKFNKTMPLDDGS